LFILFIIYSSSSTYLLIITNYQIISSLLIEGKKLFVLEKGAVFGEKALFDSSSTRAYSVRTINPCECMTLSRADLMSLLELYSSNVEVATKYAANLKLMDLDIFSSVPFSGEIDQDFLATTTNIY
jgi:CRP-like cAMP-binding protein